MQNQQFEFRPLSEYGLTPEDLVGAIALLYKRVSGDEQEFNTSLETQEEYGRALTVYLHVPIPAERGVFEDVFTGTLYRERRGLTELREEYIRLSRAGYKVIVIVYCFDRLSRDQTHFNVLMDETQHYGVKVVSVKEKFDDSPLGRVSRAVLAFAAELEHEKIIGRTFDGRMARSRRDGCLVASKKPTYGYHWDNPAPKQKKGFVIYEPEAKIVRYIFEQYAAGASMHSLAKSLEADGVPPPLKKWRHTSIAGILKNRQYLGEARAFWTKRTLKDVIAHKGGRIVPPEEQVCLPEGTIPAIISTELFDKAQARMLANIQDSPRRGKHTNALLRAGFAVCGYCGRPMTLFTGSSRYKHPDGRVTIYPYQFYICSSNAKRCLQIRAETLDTMAWERIESFAGRTEVVKEAIKKVLDTDTFEREAKSLERSIKTQEELTEQYKDDLSNPALKGSARSVVLGLLSQAQEDLERLNSELEEVRRGQYDYERVKRGYQEILEWCEKVKNGVAEELSILAKRDFMRALGVVVRVYKAGDPDHERIEVGVKMPGIVYTHSRTNGRL